MGSLPTVKPGVVTTFRTHSFLLGCTSKDSQNKTHTASSPIDITASPILSTTLGNMGSIPRFDGDPFCLFQGPRITLLSRLLSDQER